jgi:hypothetical protein
MRARQHRVEPAGESLTETRPGAAKQCRSRLSAIANIDYPMILIWTMVKNGLLDSELLWRGLCCRTRRIAEPVGSVPVLPTW